MFRDQTINFLQAAVAFLLLTNVVSAAATTWAIRAVKAVVLSEPGTNKIARRLDAMLLRSK